MALFLLPLFIGCNEEDEVTIVTGDVVAPILKDISMPSQSNTVPGSEVYINGVGFSDEDVISCTSLEGEANFTASVVSTDDYGITIEIPDEAGGGYEVSVTRANLTTVLDEHLKVAFVFSIDNLSVPVSVSEGEILAISGDGFESGDQLVFAADHYPEGLSFTVNTTLTTDGVTVTVPVGCYGVNNLSFIRGKRICVAGRIAVPVNVGDQLGGGTVFYTSDDGAHGLIVATENVAEKLPFGASVKIDPYASGTTEDIYAGKTNTESLVQGIISYRSDGNAAETSVAELCDNYSFDVDGYAYEDWFLGSLQEMVELFNYRATLDDPIALVSKNNYWTSTVNSTTVWAWAYYYVNFYEITDLVTGRANATNWSIAARPIRQF